jgi:hypothetical protein
MPSMAVWTPSPFKRQSRRIFQVFVLRDTDDPRAAFTWYRERGRTVAGGHEAMAVQS